MRTLVTALYAEGRTDERFLPIIIQRSAERILLQKGIAITDVLEPMIIKLPQEKTKLKLENRILEAARYAVGFHLLVVHQDADDSKPDKAKQERIMPGFKRVQRRAGADLGAGFSAHLARRTPFPVQRPQTAGGRARALCHQRRRGAGAGL